MRHTTPLLTAAVAWALMAGPALASSMPHADFSHNTLGLGLGSGIAASADFPLNRDWMLGVAANLSYFGTFGNFGSSVDVHALYKILRGTGSAGKLDLDILGGVQGFSTTSFDPFIGVALAYPFTPRLTGRLNLALGLPGLFPGGWGVVGPSGIELGYKFSSRLEGTIGENGHGDVLGLSYAF
ncbi:MAG TPA: hypothetical protein V6D47_00630 [Oscillatoriaceae cyanobacterium]